MEIDPKIRYAVIYDGKIHSSFRDGILGHYKQEEIESSLYEAHERWGYEEKLSFRVGDPRFTMAQYSKENRIIFPLSNTAVILVTTELDVSVTKLVDEIIKIRHDLEYSISGFYTR